MHWKLLKKIRKFRCAFYQKNFGLKKDQTFKDEQFFGSAIHLMRRNEFFILSITIHYRGNKICLKNEISSEDFDANWPPYWRLFLIHSCAVTLDYGMYMSKYLMKLKQFIEKYRLHDDSIISSSFITKKNFEMAQTWNTPFWPKSAKPSNMPWPYPKEIFCTFFCCILI